MALTRRQFIVGSAVGSCTLALNGKVQAQVMVSPNDYQAKALDYVSDNRKVDMNRHPTKPKGSNCANCALYQGSSNSVAGGCVVFKGKQVASNGWCSAYSKKSR
jgi:hypothetical protein